MVSLLVERSDTKFNVKLGEFRTRLQASYMSSQSDMLWYNETACLWMTLYIYIYIYIYIYMQRHWYLCCYQKLVLSITHEPKNVAWIKMYRISSHPLDMKRTPAQYVKRCESNLFVWLDVWKSIRICFIYNLQKYSNAMYATELTRERLTFMGAKKKSFIIVIKRVIFLCIS